MHESIRDCLRRLRRNAIRRRQIEEPPPPTCEKCGNSIAQIQIIDTTQGEQDCPHCRERRQEYHAAHGGGPSVVQIVSAPTRAEVEEMRRQAVGAPPSQLR